MAKKTIITENQLRQLIREEVIKTRLLHEQKILVEYIQALLAAAPTLARVGPTIARWAAPALKWGKSALATGTAAVGGAGIGSALSNLSKGAYVADVGTDVLAMGQKAGEYAGMASQGVQAASDTAQPFLNLGADVQRAGYQYDQLSRQAGAMTDTLFKGNKQSSMEVQQAMTSMGPHLSTLDDDGVQAIFGKDNPQQMLDVSQLINKGSMADSAMLYGAMKGLGTKEPVVRDVIQRRGSSLAQLAQEFATFATTKKERDIDLVSWLKGDGMRKEADLVAASLASSAGLHF